MLFGYVVPGPSYCQGSFEMLVNALVTALEQNGGELLLNTRVNRILTEDGLVAGVVLDGGKEIRTSTVISNVDAVQTFEELVGAEHLPASFMRRLRRMEPSFSAFVLYLATTLDMRQFEATHETFLYKHWDHDQTYRDILDGKPGGMWISVPTLIDPSIAPAGEHIVIMKSLACYDIGVPWDQAKERFTDTMLGNLDAVYPGIRDHLTFMEVATPLSLENYTLNQHGAIYGWEYTPEQTGSKRLNHVTPIEGLYLSSHWTQPGAASLRVFVSGIHTAQLVLARAGMEEVARSFRHPDLPPAV
jgi:prolycopene isomerase